MRTKAVFIHIFQALAEGALIALLVVGLMAGTAFAAKSGGHNTTSSGSTLSEPVMVADSNGNGTPNYGDSIKFNISTSASYPEVGLRCWQGTNNLVYDGYVEYYSTWLNASYFPLASAAWNPASAADCTARLFYWTKKGTQQVLATVSFTVAP